MALTGHGRNGDVNFLIQGLNVNHSDATQAANHATPTRVHERRNFFRNAFKGRRSYSRSVATAHLLAFQKNVRSRQECSR